jgi:hypothetical protein
MTLKLHPILFAANLLQLLTISVLQDDQRIHSGGRVLHGRLKIPLPCLDHRELLILRCISALEMTRWVESC